MDHVSQTSSKARTVGAAASPFGRLGYPAEASSRDQRFDFLRGFAMLSVVAAHLEFFSWFNFLFWERLGFITAAEMFVVTAGLVLGLVNRKVVDRETMATVTERLWRRTFVLWRALLVATLLVILIARLGILDMTALTTFTDRFSGQVWPMTPLPDVRWDVQVALVAMTRPH